MGGQSYSTVTVEKGLLNFTGACKSAQIPVRLNLAPSVVAATSPHPCTAPVVPSLQAPGFITAVNYDSAPWVDVSSCAGLRVTAKAATDYAGYRISFGHAHPKGGKFFACESDL